MPINSFLYPGAKVVPPFTVANSLRFNDNDTANLSRTKGTSDSTTIGTYSFWFKPSKTTGLTLIENGTGSADRAIIYIASDSTLKVFSKIGNSTKLSLATNRVFRDLSAWYNLVLAIDTTQGTASNRVKLYINGTQETSFGTETYPDQNDALRFFTSSEIEEIGIDFENGGLFDGYMCEVVKVDGQQLAPTSFGEFDSDTPNVWKPIDVSGLSFGTNGFHLDFQDSSNLGNNAAGGSDFTSNNLAATDQSTDTCDNNGCTWNLLIRTTATFTQGNLVYTAPSSNPVFGSLTTFGVNSGKWYAECKYHAGSNHYGIIGVADEVFAVINDLGSSSSTDLGKTGSALGSDPSTCTVAYVINTGKIRNNNNNQDYGSGGGDGDIINIALDRDNRKVYFGINGTYENSGNPGSGSNGFDLSSQVTGDTYFLGVSNDTGASETILDFNFGGGFGQTAVSSGNSDANGHGNFEYAVPSGFYAWNSKNLAEFG